MNTLIIKLLEFGGLPILLLIIGYLAGRYLRPWVHASTERLARAQEIALIADKITDEMLVLFPLAKWDDWLDKAVDKIIKACDLKDADIASREILGQIFRKYDTETHLPDTNYM